MPNNILFSERQRFSQWWLWLILAVVNLIFVTGLVRQIGYDIPFGDKPVSNGALILTESFLLLISLLILTFRLDTQVTAEGVDVRFFPFHFHFKHFNWKNIEKSYVRDYSAIGEYGGWGLRWSLTGKGKAYNVSGNKGLQLEFKDQKKLLIGTRKSKELADVIESVAPAN